MERRVDLSNIDLDAVAKLIALREPTWNDEGLSVEPLTWFDNEEDWPRTAHKVRTNAKKADVSAISGSHGGNGWHKLVVYAGGWANLGLLTPGSADFVWEYLELDSADNVALMLDAAISRLTVGRRGRMRSLSHSAREVQGELGHLRRRDLAMWPLPSGG